MNSSLPTYTTHASSYRGPLFVVMRQQPPPAAAAAAPSAGTTGIFVAVVSSVSSGSAVAINTASSVGSTAAVTAASTATAAGGWLAKRFSGEIHLEFALGVWACILFHPPRCKLSSLSVIRCGIICRHSVHHSKRCGQQAYR